MHGIKERGLGEGRDREKLFYSLLHGNHSFSSIWISNKNLLLVVNHIGRKIILRWIIWIRLLKNITGHTLFYTVFFFSFFFLFFFFNINLNLNFYFILFYFIYLFIFLPLLSEILYIRDTSVYTMRPVCLYILIKIRTGGGADKIA